MANRLIHACLTALAQQGKTKMKKLMMVAAVVAMATSTMGQPEVKLPGTASISGYEGYTIWFAGVSATEEGGSLLMERGVGAETLSIIGAQFADVVNGYWYDTPLPGEYGKGPYNYKWSDVSNFKKGGMKAYLGEYLPEDFAAGGMKIDADGSISLGDVRSHSTSWEGSALLAAVLIDGDGQFGTPGNDIVYGAFEMTEANYNNNQGIDGTWKFGPFTAATAGSPTPGPVPEPTSGLLLLLGVAGLALKRKRA